MKALRSFTVRPSLPPELAALEELAMNLRWSWDAQTRDVFKWVDPDAWDAAVIDVFLAKGNGLTVANHLKERKSPVQRTVVFMNHATSEVREGALSAGVDAVFDKSLQLEDFYDFCRTLGIQTRR